MTARRHAAILPLLAAAALAPGQASALTLDQVSEPPGALRVDDPIFRLAAWQPADEAEPAPIAPPPTEPTPVYGRRGSGWITFGGGIAYDLDDAVDTGLHVAYSRFIVDHVEVAGELSAWVFDEEDEVAFGLSPNITFRFHVIDTGEWTVFADAGIGLLFASDDVPTRGTSFNFMPRAGVGFTRQLTDEGARLQAGVRWHHISNARLNGDRSNPARDAPMFYAALVFPF